MSDNVLTEKKKNKKKQAFYRNMAYILLFY